MDPWFVAKHWYEATGLDGLGMIPYITVHAVGDLMMNATLNVRLLTLLQM
jgi:hypothetical protein